jgi:hypothetical protein
MQRIAEQIRQIEERNVDIARAGCEAVDRLAKDLTPARLNSYQESLRQTLLWVEKKLRQLEARRKERGPRRRARMARIPSLGRGWNDHREALQVRERALNNSRAILRQVGDAFAWLVLRADPSLIAPLSVVRNHHLPVDVGLLGPLGIMDSAHATGRFLVIDNDLTRCLGIGDITVVRADGNWVRPLPIEVKSSRDPDEKGVRLNVDVFTAVSSHPVDADLFNDFRSVLQLRDPPSTPARPSRNAQAQNDEIIRHSQILGMVTGGLRERAPPPKQSLWPGMKNLLNNALTTGACFDLLDEGIMGAAVRVHPGDDHDGELGHIITRLDELGFGGSRPELMNATTEDLKREDGVSAYVPPVALWPLPLPLRKALLGGELFYACVYDPTVWDRAMQEEGISVTREGDFWLLEKDGLTGRYNPIEIKKLTWGVLFAGVKPREVASRVAELFVEIAAREPGDVGQPV